MTCYDRLVFIEKTSHLRLSEPHRFIPHSNIHLGLSVFCLIDDYSAIICPMQLEKFEYLRTNVYNKTDYPTT